jgi:hypothetical protein
VIFHSYVSLQEGINQYHIIFPRKEMYSHDDASVSPWYTHIIYIYIPIYPHYIIPIITLYISSQTTRFQKGRSKMVDLWGGTLQLVGKWKNIGKNREKTLKWTWRISWWRMLTLRCEDVQLDYRTTLQIPQQNCKSTKILRQDTILIPFCRVLGGSRYRYVISIPITSTIIYHVLPLLYLY